MDLKNKTAIVTGAGSGIGRETALALAREGAFVVCAGRRQGNLDETVSLMQPGSGLAVSTDVTDPGSVQNLVDAAVRESGSLHILVNNAGRYGSLAPVWLADPDEWWADVTVNLKGSLLCARTALPHLMKQQEGLIVNFSGGGAHFVHPASTGYGCSKAAILRLTDTLAHELAVEKSPVITFAYDPGFNVTPMTEDLYKKPGMEKWLPGVKKMMDEGEPSFTPEVAAGKLVRLMAAAGPAWSGRLLFARDRVEDLKEKLDAGADPDYRMLRLTGRHE